MSFPIQMPHPGVKRYFDSLESTKKQRRNSEEGSTAAAPSKPLPLELWLIIASYLQGSDLKNLSKVSTDCKAAALSAKNIEQLQTAQQELRVLERLTPPFLQSSLDVLNFYNAFLSDIHDAHILQALPNLAIDPNALDRLKQILQALITQQAAFAFLNLSYKIYEQINTNSASIESLEATYARKKTHFVLQALNHLILSTKDPSASRGWAVRNAAEQGHLIIVQALLANGPLDIGNRGIAVWLAAKQGHLAVMQALLNHGEISDHNRGAAIYSAAKQGHLEVVRVLLNSGNISDDDKREAAHDAHRQGYKEIATLLGQHHRHM